MSEISTSILNVNEENSMKVFYDLETAKTDMYHIDVMDGIFVKNSTTKKMFTYANNIKKMSNLPLDIHLMVQNPIEYIDDYIALEPGYITVHREVYDDISELKKIVTEIKNNDIKVRDCYKAKYGYR